MRIKFILAALISIMTMPAFAQHLNQCCILMDVFENANKIENEFEMWDFYIDTDQSHFTLNVSSFIFMDNSVEKKPKSYYLYNWHHKAKSITAKGNGKYEILTDGRMSNFDMRIIVTVGNNNRVEDLTAYLPIGDEGKEIKQFRINKEKAIIDVAPLHNSAFISKSK